jgi:two-component system chemotaxis response regulator CheY
MIETAPRVLIADDHLIMRQFVRNVLRDLNITETETAADGAEAIRLVEKAHADQTPFDIVLLDWNMPNVTGLEVLTYFRGKPQFERTAFVMLTVETEQPEVRKAILAGATSYICKPVSPQDLARKVKDLLQWLNRRP